MNLEQIARDAYWQREIQEALSLYGNREDKLLAAKLHRKGKGRLIKYYTNLGLDRAKKALDELDIADEMCEDVDPSLDQ